MTGHVDVFAVKEAGASRGARHHLFRIESGGLLMGFPPGEEDSANGAFAILAVGAQGAEALVTSAGAARRLPTPLINTASRDLGGNSAQTAVGNFGTQQKYQLPNHQ